MAQSAPSQTVNDLAVHLNEAEQFAKDYIAKLIVVQAGVDEFLGEVTQPFDNKDGLHWIHRRARQMQEKAASALFKATDSASDLAMVHYVGSDHICKHGDVDIGPLPQSGGGSKNTGGA